MKVANDFVKVFNQILCQQSLEHGEGVRRSCFMYTMYPISIGFMQLFHGHAQ